MEGMIGEVRMFGGDFAPRNWAFCNGQLLPIAQHTALFSILGITYGGDGMNTFALPDTRGRAVIQQGKGSGLSNYPLGKTAGTETNKMTIETMPSHTHVGTANYRGQADGGEAISIDPTGAYLAKAHNVDGELKIYDVDPDPSDQFNMGVQTATFFTDNNGSGDPINNVQPSLGINYIICLSGTYPQRA